MPLAAEQPAICSVLEPEDQGFCRAPTKVSGTIMMRSLAAATVTSHLPKGALLSIAGACVSSNSKPEFLDSVPELGRSSQL